MAHEPGHPSLQEELGITPGTPTIGGEQTLTIDNVENLAPGLLPLMEELDIDESRLTYFEAYDPTREKIAAAKKRDAQTDAISKYQGQAGNILSQVYQQGRLGQSGFGGTQPGLSDTIRPLNLAKQSLELDKSDAELAELGSIKAAQDAYKREIFELLGMLSQ